jgi:hypothetical protein
MQVQTAYSGLGNNDAGDLKKRVEASLAKLRGTEVPEASAPPEQSNAPVAATVAVPQAAISIDSTPAGADIEIDGAFVGNTPSTVNVDPGSHKVAVKKTGFNDWSKTLNVTGGTIHLNAELEKSISQPPVSVPPPPPPSI